MKKRLFIITLVMLLMTNIIYEPFKVKANPIVLTPYAIKLLIMLGGTATAYLGIKAIDGNTTSTTVPNTYDFTHRDVTSRGFSIALKIGLGLTKVIDWTKGLFEDKTDSVSVQKIADINAVADKYVYELDNDLDIKLTKEDMQTLQLGAIVKAINSEMMAFDPAEILESDIAEHEYAARKLKELLDANSNFLRIEWETVALRITEWNGVYSFSTEESISGITGTIYKMQYLVEGELRYKEFLRPHFADGVSFGSVALDQEIAKSYYEYKYDRTTYYEYKKGGTDALWEMKNLYLPTTDTMDWAAVSLYKDPLIFNLHGSGIITSDYIVFEENIELPESMNIYVDPVGKSMEAIDSVGTVATYPTDVPSENEGEIVTPGLPDFDFSGGAFDSGDLGNKIADKYGIQRFINSFEKLKEIETGKGEPPRIMVPLKKMLDIGMERFIKLDNPFEEEYTFIDFKYFEEWKFGGMSVIDYFRFLESIGFIVFTAWYCWNKLIPKNAH